MKELLKNSLNQRQYSGFNDRVYGTENRKVSGDTNFVVTSGISGWAIPFKTGTKSEYVIIDVKCEK